MIFPRKWLHDSNRIQVRAGNWPLSRRLVAGMNAHIGNPFNLPELSALIKRLVTKTPLRHAANLRAYPRLTDAKL